MRKAFSDYGLRWRSFVWPAGSQQSFSWCCPLVVAHTPIGIAIFALCSAWDSMHAPLPAGSLHRGPQNMKPFTGIPY